MYDKRNLQRGTNIQIISMKRFSKITDTRSFLLQLSAALAARCSGAPVGKVGGGLRLMSSEAKTYEVVVFGGNGMRLIMWVVV